jgi:hypothetical protein
VNPVLPGLLTAPPGSHPAGALLAPLTEPDEEGRAGLALDALPPGVALGLLDPRDAPQGVRNACARIGPNWQWRLLHGEGWAVRQGKGPERGDGTRPRLVILDPCRSITLRACAVDLEFDRLTHHVVIAWVLILRTGAWKADAGWAWLTEPAPDGRGRTWARAPRDVGVTRCGQLLAAVPDVDRLDGVRAAAVSDGADGGSVRAAAVLGTDSDESVST